MQQVDSKLLSEPESTEGFAKKTKRSVSISLEAGEWLEQRRRLREEIVSQEDERRLSAEKRGEGRKEYREEGKRGSTSSFFNHGVNLARRFSNAITGYKEPVTRRKRSRRAPHQNSETNGKPDALKNRRKSRNSTAQLSLDLERGIIVVREEQVHPVMKALNTGLRRLRILLGGKIPSKELTEEIMPEIIKIEELERLEPPKRYRPGSVKELCQATGFTPSEMKRLYRGFKSECPNGVLDEETFHHIYSNFFPWRDDTYNANVSTYPHYVFSALDENDTGVLTFEDFALCLSQLINGSLKERLLWTFRLYDLNGDGVLSREELDDVATSIYELMGYKNSEEMELDPQLNEKVVDVFQAMDLNCDGVVSVDEFLAYCCSQNDINKSAGALSSL